VFTFESGWFGGDPVVHIYSFNVAVSLRVTLYLQGKYLIIKIFFLLAVVKVI
jgi:hypothetical protein